MKKRTYKTLVGLLRAADAGQFYTMDNPYIAKAIEALE